MMRLHAVVIALVLHSLSIAGLPAQTRPEPPAADLSRDTTLYAIGYSHLDTQWRWDYPTTIAQYIRNTMLDNFPLFEKYPHYIFNFSGANRYRMMREYYPKEYEKVKEYVAANRWFPCGSSMEEADALIPSPESIIRQVLYGNDFFRREFGKASNEYLLPDCFGFPASLPSVLAHCGLKGFSTQKLTWGSAIGIPFNVGVWSGPDGSSVTAAFNPGDYTTQVRENLSTSKTWLRRISDSGARSGVFADYMYYGTGDVGGSPTEESVRWVENSIAGPGPIHVISSAADRFFNDVTPQQRTALPRYTGELLLTFHSAGSLTSQAYMKRWNRKNELLANSAEASSVIGEWLGGTPYPREKLSEAWRLVLGAQFHDIMAGTSIPKAYEYSWNDEVLALNQFGATFSNAVGSVARALDTEAHGIPIVVFNPLSIAREDVVEATVARPASKEDHPRVFGPDGREVPSQVLARDGNRLTLAFLAKVPSLGLAAYDIRTSKTPCVISTGLAITSRSLENARYKVSLDAHGDVEHIYDRTVGRELLSEPIRLAFLFERPQEYPAWNMDWTDRKQPPAGYVDGTAAIRVVESGPVRVSLEVIRESRGSRFVQQIRLSAGGSADRVEFGTTIDWFTGESSLKATFPLTVSNSVATYSPGVGTVERTNNNEKRYEVPSHQWFDLTDRGGAYGVSVLEDSKFGSDKPADNVVRLTLLYTPGVRGSYKDEATQDFGRHEMLYALYGHRGTWRDGGSVWQAARLNQPLVAFQTHPHKGYLGRSFSFLTVSNPDVAVAALKKAEQSNDIILRVRETSGKPATGVRVSLPAKIVAAREVNGQEQALGEASSEGGKLTFDITPYQLRAFALRLESPGRKLGFPTSQLLSLPFDTDVISTKANKADGSYDSNGASIPAEMLPDTIASEGVIFKLGPTAEGKMNAISCNGQSLSLPEGNFNRLYLLASSIDADSKTTFTIDGKPLGVDIGQWSGFVGQWDNRLWDGYEPKERDYSWDDIVYEGLVPGYIKRNTIAFFTTHRHLSNGQDDPYRYTYLYKIRFDLPRGARNIVLPFNNRVRVLAMTASFNDNDATAPARPLYDTLNRERGDYGRFQVTPRPRIAPENCILDESTPTTITISSKESEADIRYTLDGTAPTKSSTRYTHPFTIDRTATVTAVAYGAGKQPSVVTTASYIKATKVRGVRYVTQPSKVYQGSGDVTLIDGRRGTISFSGKAWQGFEAEDLDVVVDLGRVTTIGKVTVGCLSDHTSWIFLPKSLDIAVSDDDKTYRSVGTKDLGIPAASEDARRADIALSAGGVEARYLRVKAKNIGQCPPWHSGSGGKAWLFVDEILVEP
jgi:alpha-mannosidase